MRIRFAKLISSSDDIDARSIGITQTHVKKSGLSLAPGTAHGLPVCLRLLLAGAMAFCWTLPVQAARRTTPTAPSNLSATAVSTSQINLSWQDNSGTETGFYVQRAPTSAGTFITIANVGTGVT